MCTIVYNRQHYCTVIRPLVYSTTAQNVHNVIKRHHVNQRFWLMFNDITKVWFRTDALECSPSVANACSVAKRNGNNKRV